MNALEAIRLRILVLDDEIESASGVIGDCLDEYIQGEDIFPSLHTLEDTESPSILLQGIVSQPVKLSFRCNRPYEKSAQEVSSHISNSKYDGSFDLVLLDDQWSFLDHAGQDILLEKVYEKIHGAGKELPLICLFTQHWDYDRLRRFLKLAHEKCLDWQRIIPCNKGDQLQFLHVLYRAISTKNMIEERVATEKKALELKYGLKVYGDQPESWPGIIGHSLSMRAVFSFIKRAAPSEASILILGESGTGKELIAKAFHKNSPRADKPFIAVDCGIIPDTLIESSMFGNEKGAYTGATERRIGYFEAADTGTIFLDEIGNMSLDMQAKLLRVLQEKTFNRVGGTQNLHVDVRVIAATNANLESRVKENLFRQDLYYRLDVISFILPPLRERGNDIILLTNYFMNLYCKENKKDILVLSEGAKKVLTEYSWPGNVRELKNVIERASVLCDNILDIHDLSSNIIENKSKVNDIIASNSRQFEAATYFDKLDEAYENLPQYASMRKVADELRRLGAKDSHGKDIGYTHAAVSLRLSSYKNDTIELFEKNPGRWENLRKKTKLALTGKLK